MKKCNVILIALYDIDCYAVRTLHAVLRKAKLNVNSIFFKRLNLNNTMESPSSNEITCLIKLIKELEPELIGISLRSTTFKLASVITKEIKKELNTLVLWGGIHPTIRPEQCLEFADIVCIGEGEGPIEELAEKLIKNEEIKNIPNLWFKNENKIIKNDLRPLIQNLDSVPFPDFSNENKYLVENGKVISLPDSNKITVYSIMTSRGCPFNCTYCCNNDLRKIYKDKGKYVRRRTVENVIEELMLAKNLYLNLTFVIFSDDVFTFNINWIKKFCEQYKKVVNIPFFCYCHPNSTSEEMIKLLKNTGVANMSMGIQTGSEEIRHKYYERFNTNEEIIRSAEILHKYKIDSAYDIIMDNPLETNENKRETLNLLLKLPRPFELHTHTLTYFPGTKFTNLLLEKKMISEHDIEDQKQESYNRWTPTLDLSRNKENLFWDNLYYLTKRKYIPRRFVIWLSHIDFIKRHPKPLTLLLKSTSSSIYTIKSGSKLDTIRCFIMNIFWNSSLLLKKRTWLYLWTKIR